MDLIIYLYYNIDTHTCGCLRGWVTHARRVYTTHYCLSVCILLFVCVCMFMLMSGHVDREETYNFPIAEHVNIHIT